MRVRRWRGGAAAARAYDKRAARYARAFFFIFLPAA